MSMLYMAQAAAEARPGLAIGYIAGKIGIVALIVIGLVKLATRKPSRRVLPPNFTAPQPYTQGYWVPPSWPPQAPPAAAPGQMQAWPPQSPPPARPR